MSTTGCLNVNKRCLIAQRRPTLSGRGATPRRRRDGWRARRAARRAPRPGGGTRARRVPTCTRCRRTPGSRPRARRGANRRPRTRRGRRARRGRARLRLDGHRGAPDERPAHLDGGSLVDEAVLDRLERADRPPERDPFARVVDRGRVGGGRDAGELGGPAQGEPQPCFVRERRRRLAPVARTASGRHGDVVQCDRRARHRIERSQGGALDARGLRIEQHHDVAVRGRRSRGRGTGRRRRRRGRSRCSPESTAHRRPARVAGTSRGRRRVTRCRRRRRPAAHVATAAVTRGIGAVDAPTASATTQRSGTVPSDEQVGPDRARAAVPRARRPRPAPSRVEEVAGALGRPLLAEEVVDRRAHLGEVLGRVERVRGARRRQWSRGSPRSFSPITLRWISEVPAPSVAARISR